MAKTPHQEPTLERYELVERIAGGGMGEVFRAVAYGAHGFEKDLAVKRILPKFAQNKEFEKSFVAEAKLVATLNHGNIVQVLDFGRLGGALYLAMEYVDGLDLAALLAGLAADGERIPIGVALHIAIELCKGLEFAHRKDVVHRDISPANVLLSRAGEVKIADFGIARAVSRSTSSLGTGRIVGKIRYMSPEQSRGIPLDARSDVFSTGVVLFEAASGKRLFSGDDFDSATDEIRNKPIPRLSELVDCPPPGLDDVMDAVLERDRDKRVQTAGELLRKLTRLCYAVEPPPTSLDVASIVEAALVQRDTGRSASALDDRILAELAGVGVSPREPSRVTRVKATAKATSPQTVPGTPRGKAVEAASGKTLTFFRLSAADGLSSLEIETGATVVTPPPDPTLTAGESEQVRRGSANRRGLLPVAAVAVLSLAGVAVWLGLRDRGEVATITADAQVSRAGARSADASGPVAFAGDASAAVASSADAGLDIALDATPAAQPADSPDAANQQAVRPAPSKGTIALFVEPWADVYFRGRKVARAPIQKLRLPVGTHRLRLVNPVLGIKKSVTVTVPRKQPYRVILESR